MQLSNTRADGKWGYPSKIKEEARGKNPDILIKMLMS